MPGFSFRILDRRSRIIHLAVDLRSLEPRGIIPEESRRVKGKPASTMERAGRLRWAVVVAGYAIFFVAFFWPVLSDGRFLAFGDGRTQWLPMYFGPRRLWEPDLMLGYPQFANPEQFWYPLAALRVLPHSFNAYVISAYVIAACGAYGLVRAETGSRLGAALAGLAYPLSGFMISHLQHLDIIHPAAWSPFVFWALRMLRRGFSPAWFGAGAIALALCILGGQPQIFVYTAIIAVILGAPRVVSALACVACGIALAAIVLVPGAELASQSVRATMPFYQFAPGVSLTHVPVRLFFPYLLGGSAMPAYPRSDFDLDPFVEQSNYVGIITLVLAVAAIRSLFSSGAVRLWTGIAVVALVLTTGNDLGIAAITYHVPVLALFRSQGRHAFEFALAASILGGFAVAAIETGKMRASHIVQACAGVAVAMAGVLLAIAGTARFSLDRFVPQFVHFQRLVVDPIANRAVGIPIAILLLVCGALAYFARRPRASLGRLLLLAVCTVDLTSFAWFAYWHWGALSPDVLAPPPYARAMRATLASTQQRAFPLDLPGASGSLRPNANLLWDIPSAWASFALLPSRSAALLHSVRSDFFGQLNAAQMEDDADQSFDLAAIRYFVVPGSLPMSRAIEQPWDEGYDWGRRIGAAPSTPATTFAFRQPKAATAVALVTSLGLAAQIPDKTAVANVVVSGVSGRRFTAPLLAGRDTAEIAYDRFDVRPHVRHALATVYSSDGPNHRYAAIIMLPRPMQIARIDVVWRYAADRDASLLIDKLSLLDSATRTARPVSPLFLLRDDPSRLRVVPGPGDETILENARAFPRVWVVQRVVPAGPGEALEAIRGGTTDFHKTALVEGAPAYGGVAPGTARILETASGRTRVDVTCSARCFLMTSDPIYPGWTVRVDGIPATLYAADYALRGTFIPPGHHVAEFAFFSRTLVAGIAVTLAAALVLLGLGLGPRLLQRSA